MKKALTIAALLASTFLAGAPAMATNLSKQPVASKPAAETTSEVQNWNGLYVGVFGGWSTLTGGMHLENTDSDPSFPTKFDLGADNVVWGGMIGSDYRVTQGIVAGGWFAYQIGNRKFDVTVPDKAPFVVPDCGLDDLMPGTSHVGHVTLGDQWELMARVGVLPNEKTLVYVGAGYVRADVKTSEKGLIKGSEVDGYKLVAGLETWVAPTISLRIEGSYAKFDDNILQPAALVDPPVGSFKAEEFGARAVLVIHFNELPKAFKN